MEAFLTINFDTLYFVNALKDNWYALYTEIVTSLAELKHYTKLNGHRC